MHFGLDYTAAIRQGAGIGRLTRGLVKGLSEIDRENRYSLVTKSASSRPDLPENFQLCRLPFNERASHIIWHRLGLPAAVDLFTGPVDLFHAPDYLLPPVRKGAKVITVHDLTFMVVPQYAEPKLAAYLGRHVPRSVERATLIFADSESTRQDIISLLRVPPEKVEVVYAGLEPGFTPVSDSFRLDAVRAEYGIEGPFILNIGTLEPRKNVEGLIRAFSILRRQERLPHRLLLAGGKGWLYDGIFQLVQDLELEQAVSFLGYAAEADLPALLSLADVFVYPSFYEGFGLPPLEAMACGTPVVASSAPCLPEVLGETALFVSPEDDQELAEGIRKVIEDSELRRLLIAKGRARAAQYTWAAAAEKALACYRRAVDLTGGRFGKS